MRHQGLARRSGRDNVSSNVEFTAAARSIDRAVLAKEIGEVFELLVNRNFLDCCLVRRTSPEDRARMSAEGKEPFVLKAFNIDCRDLLEPRFALNAAKQGKTCLDITAEPRFSEAIRGWLACVDNDRKRRVPRAVRQVEPACLGVHEVVAARRTHNCNWNNVLRVNMDRAVVFPRNLVDRFKPPCCHERLGRGIEPFVKQGGRVLAHRAADCGCEFSEFVVIENAWRINKDNTHTFGRGRSDGTGDRSRLQGGKAKPSKKHGAREEAGPTERSHDAEHRWRRRASLDRRVPS